MTYIRSVTLQDAAYFDAFGRLKTSQPDPLLDDMVEYGNNGYYWETATTGGSVAAVANQNALRLSTGGNTSGNVTRRQTKQYLRYHPGRSLNVETTFVMGTAYQNSRTRVGLFDANNGIFLERATDGAGASTVKIVRRTYTGGSASDAAGVAQASWNVDPMTGSGPSGKTLDLSKAQILFIQMQYLGVGRVQVGFVIDGIPYVAHQFLNANSLSTVYMSTGCLPVRAEVENTGTANGTLTFDMICTSVSSGGLGANRVRFARSNAITAVATGTTLAPVLSIRAATLFGGTGGGGSLTNRGHIVPVSYSLLVTGQITEYELLLNTTLGAGTSWQQNNAASIADYDVASTTVSGGTILDAGYLAASASVRDNVANNLFLKFPLVYSGLGSVQDTLTIAVRSVTGTGSAYAALTWDEEY